MGGKESALRIVAFCAILLLGFLCLAAWHGALAQGRSGLVEVPVAAAANQTDQGDADQCDDGKPTRCCQQTFSAQAIPVGEASRVPLSAARGRGVRPQEIALVGFEPAPEPTPPRSA